MTGRDVLDIHMVCKDPDMHNEWRNIHLFKGLKGFHLVQHLLSFSKNFSGPHNIFY